MAHGRNRGTASTRSTRRGERCVTVAECVPRDLAADWLATDPLLEAGPLPGLEQRADLRLLQSCMGVLVAKRMRASGQRALRARLWGGRARRAFLLGRQMAAKSVPTPEPLAWIREDARGKSSVLITRLAPGAPPWQALGMEAEPSARAGLGAALARVVENMHRAGFRHRDLKILNFSIEERSGQPFAWILDLDGAKHCGAPPKRTLVVRDLGRLAASFLSDDARPRGMGEEDWRRVVARYAALSDRSFSAPELAEETLAWARSKRDRNARVGRPLA